MAAYTSTILITGGTSGLGYWAAYELARSHPDSKIILASRTDKEDTPAKLIKALQKLNLPTTPDRITFQSLDLSSTASIRTFVTTLYPPTSTVPLPPLSILALNAGLQFHTGTTLRLTPDGIESTFAINHAGHALLLFLLKAHLTRTARIILTASGVHDPAQKTGLPDPEYTTAEALAHPSDSDGYELNRAGFRRYAQSKLANVLFLYALERRLAAGRAAGRHEWTVAAMDPGLMPGTGLAREMGPVVMWVANHVLTRTLWLLRLATGTKNVHLPQRSGANLAALAGMQGTEARGTSGGYFEGGKRIESSVDSLDKGKQEDLWEWTVRFAGRDEGERREFGEF